MLKFRFIMLTEVRHRVSPQLNHSVLYLAIYIYVHGNSIAHSRPSLAGAARAALRRPVRNHAWGRRHGVRYDHNYYVYIDIKIYGTTYVRALELFSDRPFKHECCHWRGFFREPRGDSWFFHTL